jgi:RNA polymerase sigma-70 factor (ECF subfamily)
VALTFLSFLVRNLQLGQSMRDSTAGNIVKVEVVKVEPSLEALMAAYTEGDSEAVREEAFRELHRRLAPKLYSHLLRLSRNPALAEDLLQVTFAKLHRARTTYLPGAKVMPWALVIARRTFLDECRGLAAQREVLGADGVLPERKSEQPSPEHVADMRRALDRLPDHYRSAIQLTKLIGFSGEEAAGLLSTTQAAIKLRVHRGYAMLRSILAGSPAPA